MTVTILYYERSELGNCLSIQALEFWDLQKNEEKVFNAMTTAVITFTITSKFIFQSFFFQFASHKKPFESRIAFRAFISNDLLRSFVVPSMTNFSISEVSTSLSQILEEIIVRIFFGVFSHNQKNF
jgi:hypothetical protein